MTAQYSTADQSRKVQEDRTMDAETQSANAAATREQDTRAVESLIDDFVNAAINMHVWEHMPPAAATIFDAGGKLLEAPRQSVQSRIGYALMLDALAQSPEALATVASELRARLVDTAPGLESLKR